MSRFSSETTEPAKTKSSNTTSAVKLNFDNISFHGCASQTDTLRRSLSRVERLEGPEIFFINGPSGCGKTPVAEVLRNEEDENNSQRKRFFASGKFDSLASRPYSAFVDAFSDLCEVKHCGQMASSGESKV
jgi:ABC-type glutathione transport system ATPase component